MVQDKLNLYFWQQSINISSNFLGHLVHGIPAGFNEGSVPAVLMGLVQTVL